MPTKCPTCHAENPDDKQFCGDCGTQLGISPDAPPSVTRTLDLPTQCFEKGSVFADRYEIIEQLGEGGMGQVYRAHDTQIEEDVAIKILRPEIALDKRMLERFRNELKFARKITHKSVCRMHDISVSDGTTYITMEYVKGEDLKSVIQRSGKLGIGQALGVVMQIADGLVEAHNLGIVHRDLKPQNIMIDPEGNAKIMDFGIARSTQAEGVTQEGSIIGTPEYMSPEQVEGRTVDQRSDIYSLAVILYEMLTGQVPFSGETVLDIALKHKTQKPDNPQQLNKKIPDSMAGLILRSMAKDPGERFQTAEDLLTSLLSIQETLPESERSVMRIVPRIPGSKAAPSSLKKALIPTVAVAAIVVIALITWRILFPPQPVDVSTGRPTVAILNINNNTGDPSFDQWQESIPEMLTYDLMQSKYISVVNRVRIYSFLSKKGLIEARNYTIEDLHDLSAEVKATHFVQGFFTKSGEEITLSVRLQHANDIDTVDVVEVSGRGANSFASMGDELTKKIKPLLGLTDEDIESDIDVNIGETSTPMQAAFNFYVQAKKAFGMFDADEAINLLDRALALDTDFAMAHLAKGLILVNQLNPQYRNSIRRAYESIKQRPLANRDRLTIEGIYYWIVDRDLDLAEKLLKELVEDYPEDYWGNHYQGIMYMHSYENREKAREHYEVLLHSGQAQIHEYHRLSTIYNGWQQYQKAREILNQGMEQLGENFFLHVYLADNYMLEGQNEKSMEELDKMYLLDPLHSVNHTMRGSVYLYMEDFQAAEGEFRKLLKKEGLKGNTSARESLIYLYKLQGRFNDGIEQITLAEEKPNQTNNIGFAPVDILMVRENWEEAFKKYEELFPELSVGHVEWAHTAAFLMAKLNKWDVAQAIVNEMNDYYLYNTSKFYYKGAGWRVLSDLKGRLEMEKGNYNQAIEYLEQAKKLIPGFHHRLHAWHVEALAKAYLESGQLEKARDNYTLITTMKSGRLEWGEIYAKSFYNLGIIAEEMGDKREARKQYTRFLELWKNADPGLPEVEDAKKRLAAI